MIPAVLTPPPHIRTHTNIPSHNSNRTGRRPPVKAKGKGKGMGMNTGEGVTPSPQPPPPQQHLQQQQQQQQQGQQPQQQQQQGQEQEQQSGALGRLCRYETRAGRCREGNACRYRHDPGRLNSWYFFSLNWWSLSLSLSLSERVCVCVRVCLSPCRRLSMQCQHFFEGGWREF